MVEFDGIGMADLGLSGLLSLAVLLILAGRLIPRSMHRSIVDLMQQRIDKLEELLSKRDRQIDRMLPAMESTAESMEKIQSVTEPERQGGDR
ncbi:hypothetical protein NXT08_22555 [Rhodococcus pyridinivorans]|uniref:hypothetical protein n=1 Tax=Rhodococcus pyridinivorans TaxID=103816 RepID=UPI0021644616|nr:hypothetical protein [Rhodococcus pyridinivorans]UVT24986.1 hypothetical protein NXT08_22555 [Rhodococcus pyridinivorans]